MRLGGARGDGGGGGVVWGGAPLGALTEKLRHMRSDCTLMVILRPSSAATVHVSHRLSECSKLRPTLPDPLSLAPANIQGIKPTTGSIQASISRFVKTRTSPNRATKAMQ